jgi:hypothetical protein
MYIKKITIKYSAGCKRFYFTYLPNPFIEFVRKYCAFSANSIIENCPNDQVLDKLNDLTLLPTADCYSIQNSKVSLKTKIGV